MQRSGFRRQDESIATRIVHCRQDGLQEMCWPTRRAISLSAVIVERPLDPTTAANSQRLIVERLPARRVPPVLSG
jgi:hypothetical protein